MSEQLEVAEVEDGFGPGTRAQRKKRVVVEVKDADGNPAPPWMWPLDVYLEAHKSEPNDWTRVHRLVVVRALLHGRPVPEEISRSHDPVLLEQDLERELSLHTDKAAKFCPWCKGEK